MRVYLLLIPCLAVMDYVLTADYGQECTEDADCPGENQQCTKREPCTKGACTCKKEGKDFYYEYTDKKCLEILWKDVGDPCSGKQDECKGELTSCKSNTCTCYDGATGSAGDSDCKYGDKKIGESCSDDEECKAYGYYRDRREDGKFPELLGRTADCENKKCVCETDFKANGGNDKCELADLKKPDESCSDSNQCDSYTYPGMVCTGNKCGCSSGYKFYDGVWEKYYKFKKACLRDGTTINLGKGEACSTSSSSSAQKRCGKGLMCATCPGETNFQCVDNATSVTVSLALLLSALLLHKLL